MSKRNKEVLSAYPQLPLFLGIFAVLLSLLPAFILGSDGFVGIHDQMDGEILVYITRARNFLQKSFPEFMNGMNANSLTPPSFGTVFLYLLLPPFAAFLCNYAFVSVIAFVGMYLFLASLLNQKWLSALVALMFSQLPFYSVYGLSVMGQPLLFYACFLLWQEKKPYLSWIITAFFAAFSSLVLVGFADFALLFLFALFLQLRKHPQAKYAWLQTGILFFVYLLPNLPLLQQILSPSDVLSHKTGWIATSEDFLSSLKTIFLYGSIHSQACHKYILIAAVFMALLGLVFYKKWNKQEKYRLWWFYGLFAFAIVIAFFYALWHSEPIVAVRNQLGGVFVSFQIDRVYWLYPAIWYILFGLILWFLLQLAKRSSIHKAVMWLCFILAVGCVGFNVFTSSVFKANTKELLHPDSIVSWDDFYSPELFEEIENYIGLPQEEYHVASVSLYPSVPLYNGFYCIDGYSNNYDLQYMQRFRSIIRNELEKSDELRSYFDDWGNRCYIFSSETGFEWFFTKDTNLVLNNLELSAQGLKDLSCDYIFSGLEIADPSASGLEFIKAFIHEDSPYKIYLYRVS